VLEQAAGLSSGALDAIAELEREVVETDGGRLKLEWGRLRRRSGGRVEDLLWWEDGRLLGFLGFYSFGSSLELAGMVAPDARRRGIGTALVDAAVPLCRGLGCREALLIVPRPSEAGKRLALRRDAVFHHSEHALVLSGEPTSGPHDSALSVRPATAADIPVVSHLLEVGFGEPAPDDLAGRLNSTHGRILVVEVDGSAVGTLSLAREGGDAGIYGFVIDPSRQGRGLGRDALRRVCEQLRADGARRVGLEVAVDNDRALALYTSVGFMPITTEDYYALPVS
jgi:ribosomal protein S18 acetylase RimI-like enzyme